MNSDQFTLGCLDSIISSRKTQNGDLSYVASLLGNDDTKALKKIGEEATELVIALKNENRLEIVGEAADLWFHTLVALARHDCDSTDILGELERRFGVSGHIEKASRT
jgi:phosphoribosyl-ATP pyrophosphohydrolase